MNGRHDIDTCREAFRMKLAEAPEMTRRRMAYWQGNRDPGSDQVVEALRQLLRDNLGRWAPRPVIEGPTPETARRIRWAHPLESLYGLDHIDDDHLRNGLEIARIVRQVTVGPSVKIMRLPVASSPDPDDTRNRFERAADIADSAAHTALLHHNVYRPWARMQRNHMPLLLGLIVEENSIETLRRRHRMRWATALETVKKALDAYAAVRSGYVSRGIQPDAVPWPPAPAPTPSPQPRSAPAGSRAR